jgi:beta-galactosidase
MKASVGYDVERVSVSYVEGYICAEWEWGGLPSWLLRDPTMRVRTRHPAFLEALQRYYAVLLPILAQLQYNRDNRGSIIAFQIENEYGSYGNDTLYMNALHQMYKQYGLDEMLFTSDGADVLASGSIENVWATVNFQGDPRPPIRALAKYRPLHHFMISEFWTGWFDFWGGRHRTGAGDRYDATELRMNLERLLIDVKEEVSINFYMFVGGTNFGFNAGAHHFPTQRYSPMVTSYDYDAPINEAGQLTPKYFAIRRVLHKLYSRSPELFVLNHRHAETEDLRVHVPITEKPQAYGSFRPHKYKSFDEILTDERLASVHQLNDGPVSMEQLTDRISVGFIVYCATEIAQLQNRQRIEISAIADNAVVFVNGERLIQTGSKESRLDFILPDKTTNLTILVDNMGRINYGPQLDSARKGILSDVLVHSTTRLEKWNAYLLSFPKGTKKVTGWRKLSNNASLSTTPHLFRTSFKIAEGTIRTDTFLRIDGGECKGVAFINGFNLGRYWSIGPQRTLYIPKFLLRQNLNSLDLFEMFCHQLELHFVDQPILGVSPS